MAFFHTLKQGQLYLKTWPLEPKLGMIFAENRIIKTTQFAQRFMPLVAVLALCWWYLFARDGQSLAAACITALFALFIPLQGLYLLGKKAQKPLSAQSRQWLEKIIAQLTEQKVAVPPQPENADFLDLARILQLAQQHLGRTFWAEL